jgi:hypothetical protein
MTDEDDTNKPPHLKLVISQPGPKRPNKDLVLSRQTASKYMAALTANLLRVIAGAGKHEQVMIDLHETSAAYAEYIRTAENAGQPIDNHGVLSQLFLHSHFEEHLPETPPPKTEWAWDQWVANGDAPERDYERKHEAISFGCDLMSFENWAPPSLGSVFNAPNTKMR